MPRPGVSDSFSGGATAITVESMIAMTESPSLEGEQDIKGGPSPLEGASIVRPGEGPHKGLLEAFRGLLGVASSITKGKTKKVLEGVSAGLGLAQDLGGVQTLGAAGNIHSGGGLQAADRGLLGVTSRTLASLGRADPAFGVLGDTLIRARDVSSVISGILTNIKGGSTMQGAARIVAPGATTIRNPPPI